MTPSCKLDVDRGNVLQLTRYVATQTPHVSEVDALTDAEALQGAIEWATPSRGFRTSSGISISKEDGQTCRQPKRDGPCHNGKKKIGLSTSSRLGFLCE